MKPHTYMDMGGIGPPGPIEPLGGGPLIPYCLKKNEVNVSIKTWIAGRIAWCKQKTLLSEL